MPKPKNIEEAPELPNIEPPKPAPLKVSFRPKPSRLDPAVWVRKLSVWSEWTPSQASELRVINLHRGLNILWAESTNDPKQPRIGGHGAGKTTFCRMLRYILDEKQPGTTEFRQDLRNIHDDCWVLAEVVLGNEPWLVGKTLGDRGRHHFAIRNADLSHPFEEQPPTGGYGDYQDALENAVLGRMKIRSLSGSGKTLEWKHLMAWLARDQEAHYASILAWRDSASESEGQDLSAVDRENLVRLVMGLVEDTEQDRLTERARVATEHETELKKRVPLDFIRKRSRNSLGDMLGKPLDDILGGEGDAPDDAILLQEMETRTKALEEEAEKAILKANLEEELKEAEQRVVDKAGSAKLQRAVCEGIRAQIQKLEGKPDDSASQTTPPKSNVEMHADYLKAAQIIGDLRGLCSRTKAEAKEKECPHFKEPGPDPQTDRAVSKQEERDDAEEAWKRCEIQRLTALLSEQSKLLAAAEAAEQEARDYKKNMQAFVDGQKKLLSEPAERAKLLRDTLTAYQTACKESTTLIETLESLDKRKDDLDKEILDLAEGHREVITDFRLLFDALAKELLCDQVTGEVRLGKGIEPDLKYRGRRKSAALNLSKLLAFDLACLALGMTSERAHHPRFIIHDSPRESDLAIGIYHSLFRAARMLEMACEGEPAFQYIVTTTEAPPEEMNGAPWRLEPVLDASDPKKRFLGVDLG